MRSWTSIVEGLRAVYEVSRSPSSLTTPNSLTTPQAATPCLWVPQHNTILAILTRAFKEWNVPNSKGVRDKTHVMIQGSSQAVSESLMGRE